MDKPITLVYEDFKSDIAELINNSGLPPFVLESVVKDFLAEIHDVAERQYEYDKEQYESSLISEGNQEGGQNEH